MQVSEYEQTQAFHKGLKFYQRKQFGKALDYFRKAIACENLAELRHTDPLYLSFYGVTLAKEKHKYDVAQKLCRIAVTNGAQFSEVFINLGQVYEACGKKTMAIDTYRMGYRRHSDNVQMLAALQRLSPRGKIPVPFLDRDHFINKYSGILIRRGLKIISKKPSS